MLLDPLSDLAELSRNLVRERWRQLLTIHGWDGTDPRCRLDNGGGPYR